jgi:hypothetical protein
MRKPTLLDVCGRKGGAAMGYIRAGFDVTRVDIEDHSGPYPGRFVKAEGVEFVRQHGGNFDAVHISAPCQANIPITAANRTRPGWEDGHVNLLPDFREAVAWAVDSRTPVVLENGPSKAIRPDLVLCGLSFGLPTLRHRAFEFHGPPAARPAQPAHISHRGHLTVGWRHKCLRTIEPSVCPKHGGWCRGTVYGVYGKGGGKPSVADAQRALGIDWMDRIEDLNEAIPPAYTEYIGRAFMAHITERRAA